MSFFCSKPSRTTPSPLRVQIQVSVARRPWVICTPMPCWHPIFLLSLDYSYSALPLFPQHSSHVPSHCFLMRILFCLSTWLDILTASKSLLKCPVSSKAFPSQSIYIK